MNIQEAYNSAAVDYDNLRRILIPCFDDFYKTAVEIIPGDGAAPLKILDLGAGTGLYSGMVQSVFPNAEFTLLDLAPEMLEKAKLRFSKMGKSPKILIGDYVETDLGGSYDLIISALSIHHLKPCLPQKRLSPLCVPSASDRFVLPPSTLEFQQH